TRAECSTWPSVVPHAEPAGLRSGTMQAFGKHAPGNSVVQAHADPVGSARLPVSIQDRPAQRAAQPGVAAEEVEVDLIAANESTGQPQPEASRGSIENLAVQTFRGARPEEPAGHGGGKSAPRRVAPVGSLGKDFRSGFLQKTTDFFFQFN